MEDSEGDGELCPRCLDEGRLSHLEHLLHDHMTLILCSDPECEYNYEGHHRVGSREGARLNEQQLRALGEYCPASLLREPALRYQHLMMVFWLHQLSGASAYTWLRAELGAMEHAASTSASYQLTPSAARMMALTRQEIQVGKHLIPDLRRIVAVLNLQYQLCIASRNQIRR